MLDVSITFFFLSFFFRALPSSVTVVFFLNFRNVYVSARKTYNLSSVNNLVWNLSSSCVRATYWTCRIGHLWRGGSSLQEFYLFISCLLYRHECFTGKYTTRIKIHKNYIRDTSGLFSIISHVSLSMT